jgi:hypothetical protein
LPYFAATFSLREFCGTSFLLKIDLGRALVKACGLGDEFSVVQKNVVRLRDNLLRNIGASRGRQDET